MQINFMELKWNLMAQQTYLKLRSRLIPMFLSFSVLFLFVFISGCGDDPKPAEYPFEVRVFLSHDSLSPADSLRLMNYVSEKSYSENVTFITKEEARKEYLGDGNEDWSKVLDENPLPNVISFNLKNSYRYKDSVDLIYKDLMSQANVEEVAYPEEGLK